VAQAVVVLLAPNGDDGTLCHRHDSRSDASEKELGEPRPAMCAGDHEICIFGTSRVDDLLGGLAFCNKLFGSDSRLLCFRRQLGEFSLRPAFAEAPGKIGCEQARRIRVTIDQPSAVLG
jgi:hypothetical protein